MTAGLLAASAVIGALIGSFLNVVVHRVPAGRSVISPPSACPACGHRIRARDNVPVLSWLILRGRCRDCAAPIPLRYPAVELATAAAFTIVTARFTSGAGEAVWAVPAFAFFVALGVALSVIDLNTRRLPNPLVLTGYLAGAPLLVTATLLGAGDGTAAFTRAGLGALAMLAFHGLVWVVYPAGMGLGDVKLAGVTGMFLAWLGWGPLAVGVMASYLIGAVAGLVIGKGRRGVGIPFGPCMFAGAVAGVLAGERVWSAYLTFLGLS